MNETLLFFDIVGIEECEEKDQIRKSMILSGECCDCLCRSSVMIQRQMSRGSGTVRLATDGNRCSGRRESVTKVSVDLVSCMIRVTVDGES